MHGIKSNGNTEHNNNLRPALVEYDCKREKFVPLNEWAYGDTRGPSVT